MLLLLLRACPMHAYKTNRKCLRQAYDFAHATVIKKKSERN